MEQLFKNGEQINFAEIDTEEKIKEVLDRMFMNHPEYGRNEPSLSFNEDGVPKEIVYQLIEGDIKVYRYEFPFIESDDILDDTMRLLYVYSRHLSRAKVRKELPILYFNMILFLDKVSLFPTRIDRVSRIMSLKKNPLDTVEYLAEQFNMLDPRFQDKFEDLEKIVLCECGSVDPDRLEKPMLEDGCDYLIFPFYTSEEGKKGECYYFTREN